MPNQAISFLYRRDWPNDLIRRLDESDNENDQVVDGFFGSSKQSQKKSDGKGGEPPKKAPEKKCPEPQKPEPKKYCSCKSKKKPAKKSRSICKKFIKKARLASKCKKPAKKMKQDKCGSTPRSRNPFIIFFLTIFAKQKNKRATDVAREAGKQWCSMDLKTKEMYQNLAKAERIRRTRKNKGARKRKCH